MECTNMPNIFHCKNTFVSTLWWTKYCNGDIIVRDIVSIVVDP